MESSKHFVSGLFCRMPNDKAPAFILLDMSFKPHEFFTWCQDRMDEKGWVNIQVKKSQKGTIYAELNTWKPARTPEQTQATEQYNNEKFALPETHETIADKQFEKAVDTSAKSFDPVTQQDIALDDIPF